MKHIDKIAAIFAVIVLIVAVVWITKACDNRHKVTEVEQIDSLQYYKIQNKFLTGQLNEALQKYEHADSLYNAGRLDSIRRADFRADFREKVRRGPSR